MCRSLEEGLFFFWRREEEQGSQAGGKEEEKFGEGGGAAFMAPERLQSAQQPGRRTLPCEQAAFVVSQTGLN